MNNEEGRSNRNDTIGCSILASSSLLVGERKLFTSVQKLAYCDSLNTYRYIDSHARSWNRYRDRRGKEGVAPQNMMASSSPREILSLELGKSKVPGSVQKVADSLPINIDSRFRSWSSHRSQHVTWVPDPWNIQLPSATIGG